MTLYSAMSNFNNVNIGGGQFHQQGRQQEVDQAGIITMDILTLKIWPL